jgi:protein-S-isoprenylcysteine O-methyltransferase Ste14
MGIEYVLGEPVHIPLSRRFIPVVFSLAITSLCLFVSAGRLDWPNAWILLGLNFAASVATAALLWRHTELLAERSNIQAGKSWDKAIVAMAVLVGPAATWITAGLDFRFHWSEPMPRLAFIAGVVIAVLAAALIAWAMRSNKFFSSVVRVQKDRGHVVVTSGPIVWYGTRATPASRRSLLPHH